MRMYGMNNTAAAKSGAEQAEEAEQAGECVGLEGKLLSCLHGVGECGFLSHSFSSPGLSDWRTGGGKQRTSGGRHAKKETSRGGADESILSWGGADESISSRGGADEPISSQGRGRADEPIPVEYLVVARLLNGENTSAHTGSDLNLRSNLRGLRRNTGSRHGERLQKGQLVELLCQHLEDRKCLEEAGLRDVYTENNSIRLGNTAFVELFGVQDRKPYTGKYDIMEARAGSVKFYTMIPRSER